MQGNEEQRRQDTRKQLLEDIVSLFPRQSIQLLVSDKERGSQSVVSLTQNNIDDIISSFKSASGYLNGIAGYITFSNGKRYRFKRIEPSPPNADDSEEKRQQAALESMLCTAIGEVTASLHWRYYFGSAQPDTLFRYGRGYYILSEEIRQQEKGNETEVLELGKAVVSNPSWTQSKLIEMGIAPVTYHSRFINDSDSHSGNYLVKGKLVRIDFTPILRPKEREEAERPQRTTSVTPAEGDRWCSRVRCSLEDRKKQGRFFRSQEAASSERENLTLEREFLTTSYATLTIKPIDYQPNNFLTNAICSMQRSPRTGKRKVLNYQDAKEEIQRIKEIDQTNQQQTKPFIIEKETTLEKLNQLLEGIEQNEQFQESVHRTLWQLIAFPDHPLLDNYALQGEAFNQIADSFDDKTEREAMRTIATNFCQRDFPENHKTSKKKDLNAALRDLPVFRSFLLAEERLNELDSLTQRLQASLSLLKGKQYTEGEIASFIRINVMTARCVARQYSSETPIDIGVALVDQLNAFSKPTYLLGINVASLSGLSEREKAMIKYCQAELMMERSIATCRNKKSILLTPYWEIFNSEIRREHYGEINDWKEGIKKLKILQRLPKQYGKPFYEFCLKFYLQITNYQERFKIIANNPTDQDQFKRLLAYSLSWRLFEDHHIDFIREMRKPEIKWLNRKRRKEREEIAKAINTYAANANLSDLVKNFTSEIKNLTDEIYKNSNPKTSLATAQIESHVSALLLTRIAVQWVNKSKITLTQYDLGKELIKRQHTFGKPVFLADLNEAQFVNLQANLCGQNVQLKELMAYTRAELKIQREIAKLKKNRKTSQKGQALESAFNQAQAYIHNHSLSNKTAYLEEAIRYQRLLNFIEEKIAALPNEEGKNSKRAQCEKQLNDFKIHSVEVDSVKAWQDKQHRLALIMLDRFNISRKANSHAPRSYRALMHYLEKYHGAEKEFAQTLRDVTSLHHYIRLFKQQNSYYKANVLTERTEKPDIENQNEANLFNLVKLFGTFSNQPPAFVFSVSLQQLGIIFMNAAISHERKIALLQCIIDQLNQRKVNIPFWRFVERYQNASPRKDAPNTILSNDVTKEINDIISLECKMTSFFFNKTATQKTITQHWNSIQSKIQPTAA